jgi:hypothetical protein
VEVGSRDFDIHDSLFSEDMDVEMNMLGMPSIRKWESLAFFANTDVYAVADTILEVTSVSFCTSCCSASWSP